MGIARNIKIGQRLHREGHSLLAKVMKLEQRIVYSCDIPYQASIARNVHFDHNGFGCVINQRAVIEGPCEIQHAVTLGELEAGGPVPVIRKGAYIGAKATILGGGCSRRECEGRRRGSCAVRRASRKDRGWRTCQDNLVSIFMSKELR